VIFHSKKVEEGPGGRLTVVGDLTIRGVIREAKLDEQRPSREVHGGCQQESNLSPFQENKMSAF